MTPKKLTLAVYSLDLPSYACPQIRLLQPAYFLRKNLRMVWAVKHSGQGCSVSLDPLEKADMAVICRYFPMPDTAPVLDKIFASGLPVIYETDDDFLNFPKSHPMYEKLSPGFRHMEQALHRADLVTVSTTALKSTYSGLNENIRILPNLINFRIWNNKSPRPDGPVRIGFAGTLTHEQDAALITEAVMRTREKLGGKAEFSYFGMEPDEKLRPFVSHIPFDESYAGYVRTLCAQNWDIALCPLADTAFNRAKSNIKWLEYSAARIAGIYQDLGVYSQVRHGVNGLLAGENPGEWAEALAELVDSPALLHNIRVQAAVDTLAGFDMEAMAHTYFKTWKSALTR